MRKFSSTIGYTGEKAILVNGDRILFVERLSEPERYIVHFDTGQELEVEQVSGKILIDHLQRDGECYIPAPQVSFSTSPRIPRRY